MKLFFFDAVSFFTKSICVYIKKNRVLVASLMLFGVDKRMVQEHTPGAGLLFAVAFYLQKVKNHDSSLQLIYL